MESIYISLYLLINVKIDQATHQKYVLIGTKSNLPMLNTYFM